MAVLSILVVALFHGASAQTPTLFDLNVTNVTFPPFDLNVSNVSIDCNGAYFFSEVPIGVPDVCFDNYDAANDLTTSIMYMCEGDTGYIMSYAGSGCSGTGARTNSSAFLYVECSAATCDYAVVRTNNASTGDYQDYSIFLNQCSVGSDNGTVFATETTCTDSTLTTTNCVGGFDCSGSFCFPEPADNNTEVLSCSATADPDTDTDTDTETSCAGLYLLGSAFSPLDVCMGMNNGSTLSMMYTCDGDEGTQMMYESADCSGTGTDIGLETGFTIECSGDACAYLVGREYTKDENGDCTDMYEEVALFTDRCLVYPDEDNNFALVSFMVSCSGSSGTEMNYTDSACSTLAATKSTDDDECSTVTTCSAGVDSGDSSSTPVAMLALAMAGIAALA